MVLNGWCMWTYNLLNHSICLPKPLISLFKTSASDFLIFFGYYQRCFQLSYRVLEPWFSNVKNKMTRLRKTVDAWCILVWAKKLQRCRLTVLKHNWWVTLQGRLFVVLATKEMLHSCQCKARLWRDSESGARFWNTNTNRIKHTFRK